MRKTAALLWLCVAGSLGGGEPELKRFEYSEPCMGTTFRIVLYAKDEATARRAAKAAFARAHALDATMSDYRPTSELMQLCRNAGGDPVPVSEELFTILEKSRDVWKKSSGAFDVTVGPYTRLWRRARRTRTLPEAKELESARKLVGFEKVRLDPEGRTVQLLVAGMLLDLGGIAKGYAAELLVALLREMGVDRCLVAAGGDIVVGEPPPGAKGWKVGIQPLEGGEPSRFLLLRKMAVSTAGDIEQYVVIDGRRYSHIVDPKTGLGLTTRISVTVAAPEGATADGLDTAAAVMGVERGLKMIEATEGAAAFIVIGEEKGQRTIESRRWSQWEWKQP